MSPNTINTKKSELAAAAAAGRAAAAAASGSAPAPAPAEQPDEQTAAADASASASAAPTIAKTAKATARAAKAKSVPSVPGADDAGAGEAGAGDAGAGDAVAGEAGDADAVEADATGSDVAAEVEETAADKLASDADTVDELIASVTGLLANLRKHRSSMRATMKSVTALQKVADKKTRKPRRASGDEQAGGASGGAKPRFGNPVGISPELAAFMGIPAESLVHRNDATNFVHKYVISNNLRMETNKRIFIPDAALKSILADTADGTEIGYFNLQKFIKHNFHTNK